MKLDDIFDLVHLTDFILGGLFKHLASYRLICLPARHTSRYKAVSSRSAANLR